MLVRCDSNLSVSSEASTRARQLLASRGLEALSIRSIDTKVPATMNSPSLRPSLDKVGLYTRQDESESTHHEDLPVVNANPFPPPTRIECVSKNSRTTNRARQLVKSESWRGLHEMAQLHASLSSRREIDDESDDDSRLSLYSSDDDDDDDDSSSSDDEEDVLLFQEGDG